MYADEPPIRDTNPPTTEGGRTLAHGWTGLQVTETRDPLPPTFAANPQPVRDSWTPRVWDYRTLATLAKHGRYPF